MKTRILKTKLADELNRQLQTCTKAALADRIGVSPQKLNAMVSDQWDYITRESLERTADYLELDVADIFELVTVNFWEPIEEANGLVLLGRSHDSSGKDPNYLMPRYDDEATYVVKNFMRKYLPKCDELHLEGARLKPAEIEKRARHQNCIVIGGPKTNSATEIVLSRFFGATPNDASAENHQKIPFGFCWPREDYFSYESSLTCSDAARIRSQNRPGITLVNGPHVPADYKPPQEFRAWQTDEGLDCGIVFVANKPFRAEKNVKLIVLAGFGGMGTLAAAKALVQDFRYLEPIDDQKCVYGIVEGKYRKNADSSVCEFRTFRWRYRKGGHSPIK